MIAPLHIDDEVEHAERMRFGRRVQRAVKKLLPWFALDSWPPYGRKSAELQLSARNELPISLWGQFGNESGIVPILRIIQQQCSWPNYFFIPDDPLAVVLTGYDFDEFYTFIELDRRLNVKYSKHEIQMFFSEKWTLGRFVADVLKRVK